MLAAMDHALAIILGILAVAGYAAIPLVLGRQTRGLPRLRR